VAARVWQALLTTKLICIDASCVVNLAVND